MGNLKISQLPAASSSSNGDLYPLVQGGVNKSITFTNLATAFGTYAGFTQLTGDITAGPGSGSQVASLVATSNSTLTTLSALTSASSLAISGSQVSGGTFGAVNGSAITNLSASALSGVLPVGVTGGSGLSIATSQLTGSVSLTTQVSGILPVVNGGTGNASFVSNQVIVGGTTSTGALAQVGTGTSGQVLTSNGSAAPTWTTPLSGTVTSVGLADGSTTPIYTISGSPVTSSGTLTFTLNTQLANTVLAGPASGSAAEPTFRGLVIADLSFAGVANGVATLDSGGRIPIAQLPNAVFIYQGLYNPSTNTPILADGTGITGQVYYISTNYNGVVAGAFGGASLNFSIGDLAVYNGTQWELTTPAAGVSSVNGAYGAVIMSMATANGFAGTYSGTALTVSTTLTTPVVAANGTALIAATTTGTGAVVLATSPTLVTPVLGTPSAIVLTNATGTAAGLTAGTVTTNANLTGPITSVGNATSIASQTGTGTTFAMSVEPSFVGPVNIQQSADGNGNGLNLISQSGGQEWKISAYNSGTLLLYNGTEYQFGTDGLIIGPQGGVNTLLGLNSFNPSTTITTPELTPALSMWNADNTANNFTSINFGNSTFASDNGTGTSAVIAGVNENQTSSATGHLSLLTSNAGTLAEGLRIQHNQLIQLPAYTTPGVLVNDSSGNITSSTAYSQVLVFTSSTSPSGAASEVVTFTGLLSTDTILSVTQQAPGAANLPLLGYSGLANNSLTLTWVADPGTGYVVIVSVKR